MISSPTMSRLREVVGALICGDGNKDLADSVQMASEVRSGGLSEQMLGLDEELLDRVVGLSRLWRSENW